MLASLQRRDFLKLNLFAYIQLLFTKSFAVGTVIDLQKSQLSLLDKLLTIDFSEVVKKEITYRVGIQKKYGLNQNGKILPLDRFVSEGANFVVYSGTLRDLGLFYEAAKPSTGYLVTRAAYYDKADKLDFFLQKMIGEDKQIFAKAALAALDAKSLASFVKIMSHKNQIDNHTMDKIHAILCSDRYAAEVGTLKNILPNLSSKKQVTLTPSFSSMFKLEDDYALSDADKNMVLLDAAKEGVKYLFLILQKRGDIEYFEVFVQRKKTIGKEYQQKLSRGLCGDRQQYANLIYSAKASIGASGK